MFWDKYHKNAMKIKENYLSIFEIKDFYNWNVLFQITLVDNNYTIALPIVSVH